MKLTATCARQGLWSLLGRPEGGASLTQLPCACCDVPTQGKTHSVGALFIFLERHNACFFFYIGSIFNSKRKNVLRRQTQFDTIEVSVCLRDMETHQPINLFSVCLSSSLKTKQRKHPQCFFVIHLIRAGHCSNNEGPRTNESPLHYG